MAQSIHKILTEKHKDLSYIPNTVQKHTPLSHIRKDVDTKIPGVLWSAYSGSW